MAKKISRRELERRAQQRARADRMETLKARMAQLRESGVSVTVLQSFDQIIG